MESKAKAYLEEAKLTLDTAKAIFKEADRTGKKLWSKVVKEAYDAMENCVAVGISLKKEEIPRPHPSKIAKFISLYGLEKSEVAKILIKWLTKRARAQYVDFNQKGKLRVPHKEFTEEDAKEAIKDCQKIINYGKNLLGNPISKKKWQNLKEKYKILKKAAEAINVQPEKLPKAIQKFQREIERMKKRKKKLEKVSLSDLERKVKSINDLEYLVEKIPGGTMADLIEISDKLKKENRILILAGVTESGVRLLGKAGKLVAKKGMNITEIMRRPVNFIDGEVSGDEYQSKGGGPKAKEVDQMLKGCKRKITSLSTS